METRSLAEMKKEMQHIPHKELVEICLRLGRYKKINKELLQYLLFEKDHETAYVARIKDIISTRFAEMPQNSLFFSTKYIRKTLRLCKQYGQYSSDAQTPVQLNLHFCEELIACRHYWQGYTAIEGILQRTLLSTRKDIGKLHEDLQYDYEKQVAAMHI